MTLLEGEPQEVVARLRVWARPTVKLSIPFSPNHPSSCSLLHFLQGIDVLVRMRCQTGAEYSRMGCTRAVYALVLASLWQSHIVLLSRFRMRDALAVTSVMWSPHFSLLLMVTPRYLKVSTHSRVVVLML